MNPLFSGSCEVVRDALWKNIYIPTQLYKAVKTNDFIRLTKIKQLGPTSLVYPSATHTRAAHSFGVYHVATMILERLLACGANEWITDSGSRAFVAAAFFHDLGHFPFTHSLKELPLREHENLTAQQIMQNPLYDIIGAWGASPQQTAAIIDDSIPTEDSETLFFRHILSGVLDPDKIDYLNRDAFFCGVPYGIQDTDFILSQIQPNRERGISIESKGISAVENVLFSKYLMYRTVYWHKSVRMATAMMKKAITAALHAHIIAPEELYALDDDGLFYLLHDRYKKATKSQFPEYLCAHELQEQALYIPAVEIPFDNTRENHLKLENPDYKTHIEQCIANDIGCPVEEIVIDIPERITFESDLLVSDTNTLFPESATVFSSATLDLFVSLIRKIRIGVYQKKITIYSKKLQNAVEKYL